MEEGHVVMGVKENKKLDSIFALFGGLVGEENENPKYCLTLIKSLRESDFCVGTGNNLDYSLKRLVRGLGSNRSYSQCGCFAALTCVLKYQACTVESLLKTLEKEQKPPLGATKTEIRALSICCVLTCGAIIHSGLFVSQSSEIQKNILIKLIEAGKKKSYLIPVICQFLVDVVNVVNEKQFNNIVWPPCQTELLQNLSGCEPEIFYLLLACQKHNFKIVNKFLLQHFITNDLFIESIIKCLFNSSVKSNHPIFDNLGQFICSNATSPDKFWAKCVNENAKINAYKDTLLITIFFYITKNLNDATIIPKLLVPKFIEILIKNLSLKKSKYQKNDCTNIAKDALNSMINLVCAEGTSQETKFQIINKLLFYPANLKFDVKTGTKCISNLVAHLSCNFIKKLIDVYRQVVSDEVKKKVDEDGSEENWNSKEKQHALHILTKTLNHPSLKKEIFWKLKEIKFIFEVGFLKKFQLPSEVQKCAKDCFYKAIIIQTSSLKDLIVFLDELALHVNENIKCIDVKSHEDVENYWNKMYFTVETLKRISKNNTFAAVHVLLIYMGLHLFVDCELAKNGIEELLSCYRHLEETQKKKGSKDESVPHWTEVTVDLILSLLSRENRLWRHVVASVFPQVVTQITPSALQQIIDALDPKSQNEVLGHVDSDDSEPEEDSESSSSEDEEETDSEEADDEGKPNDQLRLAVRNALGYSAAHTDDESVDMDQMDEEEERRLNDSLSEAFRQFRTKAQSKKKKKQTKEDEALTHFRLRVLDLIEIYVTNSPSMAGCLDLLLPLLDLLELSIKDHHQRPLQSRVDSVLKQVSSVRAHSSAEAVTQQTLKEVFRSVIGRKDTSALVFVEMSPRISDCATYLVRCSQSIPHESPEVPLVDEYESLMETFFLSRDSKLPISMFQAVLRMCWEGNFKIISTLFRLLASSNLRIFKKMKIIDLLRIFYKNVKLHDSCDKDSILELNQTEIDFIRNFCNSLEEFEKTQSKSSEKMYLSFFSNVFSLINTIQSNFKKHRLETIKMPPWKKLVKKLAELELITNNKRTRSQLGNLAGLFKVELPASEKTNRKRKLDESSKEKSKEGAQIEESTEGNENVKKKKMSPEKRKLKKESRKLREQISSTGLSLVRFSTVDLHGLPEPETEEEKEAEQEEINLSVRKKRRKTELNGSAFN